jgi:hypothetical protein
MMLQRGVLKLPWCATSCQRGTVEYITMQFSQVITATLNFLHRLRLPWLHMQGVASCSAGR